VKKYSKAEVTSFENIPVTLPSVVRLTAAKVRCLLIGY